MKKELLRIYLKYKKQLVPVVLVSVSFFILFRIILPQFTEISEMNRSIDDKNREVEALSQTLNLLSTLNAEEAASNLSVATRALPVSKDISFIFSALTGAAAASGVNLNDFSLTVGNLYARSGETAASRGVPVVNVSVRVSSSNPQDYVNFANEIQERLPIAEIKSIDKTSDRATFELGFYYKPLDLSLASRQPRVAPLNQAQINLLNELKDWNN